MTAQEHLIKEFKGMKERIQKLAEKAASDIAEINGDLELTATGKAHLANYYQGKLDAYHTCLITLDVKIETLTELVCFERK